MRLGSRYRRSRRQADAGARWLIEEMPGSWVCPISIQAENKDIPAGAECSVQIVLNERRPIDLLFGRYGECVKIPKVPVVMQMEATECRAAKPSHGTALPILADGCPWSRCVLTAALDVMGATREIS